MAAYYPDEPSYTQKSLMRSMMEGLAEFYPCSICAEHLKHQVSCTVPATCLPFVSMSDKSSQAYLLLVSSHMWDCQLSK